MGDDGNVIASRVWKGEPVTGAAGILLTLGMAGVLLPGAGRDQWFSLGWMTPT